MLALYEITNDYLQTLTALEDMDLPEEVIADTLESLSGELEVKAVNVAAFFQNLDAEAKTMKEAGSALIAKSKAISKRSDSLKAYLKLNMETSGITKIKGPLFSMSIQNNPASLCIRDEALIPSEFKSEKTVQIIDNAAIKAKLKAGESVDGAELTQGTRLTIK